MDKIWFVAFVVEQYRDIEEVENDTSCLDVLPFGAFKSIDSAVERVKNIVGNNCYYDVIYDNPGRHASIELYPEEKDEIEWCEKFLSDCHIPDRKLGHMEIRFSVNEFEVQ